MMIPYRVVGVILALCVCLDFGVCIPSGDHAMPVTFDRYTSQDLQPAPVAYSVHCSSDYDDNEVQGCRPSYCARHILDEFVTPEEIEVLLTIAKRGMAASAPTGGPTLFDVNSGYMLDSNLGLVNVYKPSPGIERVYFSDEEYALYRRVFAKIRQTIMSAFNLEQLWFTAPTFITRIVGNSEWEPRDMHDEYWHPHVDKNNTAHYDYSGLLYLADYGIDFTGGKFAFFDGDYTHTVEPRKGRFSTFNAGQENLHRVYPVESGTRYVMSMWFTCDESKEFENFFDGKLHAHFRRKDTSPETKQSRSKGSGSEPSKAGEL